MQEGASLTQVAIVVLCAMQACANQKLTQHVNVQGHAERQRYMTLKIEIS